MPGSERSEGRLAGAILAGGRSRRMGGGAKALMPLAGKPLLQHVIDHLGPQVETLCLSVEQPAEALAAFGLPQVGDPQPDAGPLAGLLMALRKVGPEYDWLLLAPCDAPFLPLNLAEKLRNCALDANLPGAVVRYLGEIQPTFSIWSRALLPQLEAAVVSGKMSGFKQFLQVTELASLDWPPSEPSPFFNINDQEDLLEAGRLLESAHGIPKSCSA